jgi:hypothetical protein
VVEINNRNPTGEPGYVPVCENNRNTPVILTTGIGFVNDINQAGVVSIVLVNLSDKIYNELNGIMECVRVS